MIFQKGQVACVLKGIRKPAKVENSLTILQWEPAQNPKLNFEAISVKYTPQMALGRLGPMRVSFGITS